MSSQTTLKNLQAICRLCGSTAEQFFQSKDKTYFQCENCMGIFIDEAHLLKPEAELARYNLHNNNTSDLRYRNFVRPITDVIEANFTPQHKGLDFGCGPGPVIAEVLREKGYNINTYDPFFDNRPEMLLEKYDYIACCEVIEHFHNPGKEFAILRSLLKKNGQLIIMTDPYHAGIDFSNWYYKNDPTHVFLYREDTFQWIRQHFNFSRCEISGRLMVFSD